MEIKNKLWVATKATIGMTKLSEKTGINRGYLYTILSKEGNPNLETLLKIAVALRYSVELESFSD